jgi:hypothetical protein
MPAETGRSRVLFFVLSCYLIGTFLYRTLTPAHEYALRSEQLLTIGLDCLAVIGLAGLRAQGPKPLFWTALLAGICLLLIRFTSDASWWTGHLMYSLSPR